MWSKLISMITVEILVGIIVAFTAALGAIYRWIIKPQNDMRDRIAALEAGHATITSRIDNIQASVTRIEKRLETQYDRFDIKIDNIINLLSGTK